MTLAYLMAELGERMEIGAFELDFDGGPQIVLDDEVATAVAANEVLPARERNQSSLVT